MPTHSFRRWLRRHRRIGALLAILFFLFVFLPQYAESMWSLVSERPLFVVVSEKMSGWQTLQIIASWITTPLAFGMLLGILYLLFTGRSERQEPSNPADAGKVEELTEQLRVVTEERDALKTAKESGIKALEALRKEAGRAEESARTHAIRAEMNHGLLEQLKTEYGWLHELAKNEKTNFDRYVYLIFRKVKYEGLDEIEPYIEIIFDIINASVYPIIIDKNIESGAVYFNDIRLRPKLAELDGSLHSISRDERGEKWALVIRQGLAPELAQRIKRLKPDDKLYFNKLHLKVRAKIGNTESEPQRLSLPNEISIGTMSRPDAFQIAQSIGGAEKLNEALAEISTLKSQLEEEKAKSEQTKLTGEIEKVHVDALVDCFITIRVRVVNEGVPTTISGFSLLLKDESGIYEGKRATVDEYFIERKEYHAVAFDTQTETLHDPLKDLAKDDDVLLVRGAHRTGWLRFAFIFGAIDTKFLAYDGQEQMLKEGVELHLIVYDAFGNEHYIDYVSSGKPQGVEIRRFPKSQA